MSPLAMLWAQGLGDLVIFILVVVIAIVSYVIQQIGRLRQPQRPPGAARGGDVESEIGEFLRRAGRPRGPQKAPPPRPAEQPVAAEIVETPVGGRVTEHTQEYLNSSTFTRRAAELGGEVAQADDLLQQRLHQKFGREVGRLGAVRGESARPPAVAEAEGPEDRVGELPATAAAGLPALFSSTENIRRAIIINEILQRPQDRWT